MLRRASSSLRQLLTCSISNNVPCSSKWVTVTAVRHLLSDSYKSDWYDRRKDRINMVVTSDKFDPYEYVTRTQRLMKIGTKVTASDLDLAVHSADELEMLDMVKDILYRYRRSAHRLHVLPSTHDAFVRQCLYLGNTHMVVDVLEDTINYGVFPSVYAINLMIDHYLRQENYPDALRVGDFLMRQEDLSNPLSNLMLCYAAAKWIETANSLDDWVAVSSEEGEVEEADDDYDQQAQEHILKVPFLKNPYFDNHFDVSSPRQVTGRILNWMSKGVQSEQFDWSSSAQLLGACLYGRTDPVKAVLKRLTHDKTPVIQSVISHAQAAVVFWKQQAEEYAQREPLSSGEVTQVLPEFEPEPVENWSSVEQSLSELSVSDNNQLLSEAVLNDLKANQSNWEANDLKEYNALLEQWDKMRISDQAIDDELSKLQDRLPEIEKERAELDHKSKVYSFFEHREEYERLVSHVQADWSPHDKETAKDATEQTLSDDEYAQVLVERFRQSRRTNKLG